jgi:hypothetical protein
MTTDDLGVIRTNGGGLRLFQALPTFWGVAVLIALAGYSLVEATTAGSRVASTARSMDVPVTSSSASITSAGNAGPYPALEPEPMVLYLACNQEDASFDRISNRPPPGRYPFTMRLDQVPDDIRAVLNGSDTTFPKDARVVKTQCIQGMIDSGALP